MKTRNKGILALVLLTAIYGLTAVMSRYFSESTSVLEQWYIRFGLASACMAIFLRKKIRFCKFMTASRYELKLMTVRGVIGFLFGAGLYALSSQKTDIASVTMLQVVPTTALLGVLILREKLPTKKIVLIAMSFIGALVILVPDLTGGFSFGEGELLSLASGALFSLTFVLRKKQTGELNNYELAFGTLVVGAMVNYIASVIWNGRFWVDNNISPTLLLLFIGAAVLSVLMSLLSSYGFEHVQANVASVILDLELVFGIFFGYLFYREVLSVQKIVGAGIILVSMVLMNVVDSKEFNTVAAPSPE